MPRVNSVVSSSYNRSFFVIFFLIVGSLITETAVARIHSFTFKDPSSFLNLSFFCFMVGMYLVGQYFIFKSVLNMQTAYIGSVPQSILNPIVKRIIVSLQGVLAAILVTVALQLLFISGYSPLLLKVVLLLSYIQAIFLTSLLAYKFVIWLRMHQSNALLLYALALGGIAVNASLTLVYINEYLKSYDSYIKPHGSDFLPYVDQSSLLVLAFQSSVFGSYVLMWLATVFLLRSHSNKIDAAKYWGLVTIPLLYFILQFQPFLLQSLAQYRIYEPVLFGIIYTLFFSSSTPIGGFLFGVAFWITGNKINSRKVKDSMIISGCGIILFFVSNQAIILNSAPYPPIGLVTVSFLGIASYVLLIGIYSSAMSVSQDITLRKSIRRSLESQSVFLDKIGTSEMEQQIQKKILHITSSLAEEMESKSGVESSLEPNEVKEYVSKVMSEVRWKGEDH